MPSITAITMSFGAVGMIKAAILQLIADCMSADHFGNHIVAIVVVVVVIAVANVPELQPQILNCFLPLFKLC